MEEQKVEELEPILENPEEIPEEKPEEVPVEEPKPEEPNYEKELQEIEAKEKPKLTELDRAIYTRKQLDDRIRQLGGEPPKEGEYVTKDDLTVFQKEIQARQVSTSDAEFKLIMHYVGKGLTVEDAKLLANKKRFSGAISEIERARESKPGQSSGPGQRIPIPQSPKHPDAEILQRRGYRLNLKTGTWQAKFNEEFYDEVEKRWKSRKIVA